VDASWCMRRSKDLESGAPDKIRTRDLSLQSAASLQQSPILLFMRSLKVSSVHRQNPWNGIKINRQNTY
jgi:hypothetical protein